MESRRKRSSSGEIFSSPSTPIQDSDFEFGCLTPDSPSQDPSTDSPADHLFFNGRLLPHSFPFHQRQPPPGVLILSPDNISRATSRTSSVSSKDSLMSSRSNSTNSRRSSSSFTSTSSARSSLSSEISERRFLYYYNNKAQCSSRATMASKMVTAQLYGSSQRWQYLTPVPTLKREASQRQNNGGGGGGSGWRSKKKIRTGSGDHHERSKGGICRTIFMAFLFACRECHAMEP